MALFDALRWAIFAWYAENFRKVLRKEKKIKERNYKQLLFICCAMEADAGRARPAASGKPSLSRKMGSLHVGSASPSVYDEIVSKLDNPLPHWERIKVGTLPNGLQYYILSNKVPSFLPLFFFGLSQ